MFPIVNMNKTNNSNNKYKFKKAVITNKNSIICLFCNGEKCVHCGLDAYKSIEAPALEKLHSSWITESIIASQRLNEQLLKSAEFLHQLKQFRITAIFNLTEPGMS